ncbi:unnamed protein product [Didymodactylos carnosus]|uniref:BUD13 homolog n=1 Tax=Didymodactylos carnosus TaxID=1234261 RepID=A0A813WMV9_9BILA|nr:unnamed protein product [Didymodactylos carnosus]CAF3644960.1 unnamed protein product [Didymodactylos carnosus]
MSIRIIDDDLDIPATSADNVDSAMYDDLLGTEETPVIVGLVDDRPSSIQEIERFNDQKRWRKLMSEDTSTQKSSNNNSHKSKKNRRKSSDSDPDLERQRPSSVAIKKEPIDLDLSPPRQRRLNTDDDPSPPRQRRLNTDDDPSPPRKQRSNTDDDPSPPRRRRPLTNSKDPSPPRQRRPLADSSLPRQHSSNKNRDHSSERNNKSHHHHHHRNHTYSHDERKSRNNKDDNRERQRKRSRSNERPQSKLNNKNDQKKTVEETKEVIADRYQQWGRGLAQVKEHEDTVKDFLEQSEKPLARYRDDKDLESMLKEREREDDPMLKFLSNKKEGTRPGEIKQRYKGPDPQKNRFDIWPGYRWDGVDRSNGHEKKLFEMIASRHARSEEAYLWSVEDM